VLKNNLVTYKRFMKHVITFAKSIFSGVWIECLVFRATRDTCVCFSGWSDH